jgi:hypothetical protein
MEGECEMADARNKILAINGGKPARTNKEMKSFCE